MLKGLKNLLFRDDSSEQLPVPPVEAPAQVVVQPTPVTKPTSEDIVTMATNILSGRSEPKPEVSESSGEVNKVMLAVIASIDQQTDKVLATFRKTVAAIGGTIGSETYKSAIRVMKELGQEVTPNVLLNAMTTKAAILKGEMDKFNSGLQTKLDELDKRKNDVKGIDEKIKDLEEERERLRGNIVEYTKFLGNSRVTFDAAVEEIGRGIEDEKRKIEVFLLGGGKTDVGNAQ